LFTIAGYYGIGSNAFSEVFMIPLSSAISGGLTFSKPSRSRIHQLKRNHDVVGTLLRPSFWSMTYQAETQTGTWTFRREGWLGGRSEIRDGISRQQIATFKMAWGSRGGKLTFADGQTFQLACKGWWRPLWTVFSASGEPLLRLHRREKKVELQPASTVPAERLALLILFAWYHVLQSEEDASAAAVIAAT
jgi:hypothetical protein